MIDGVDEEVQNIKCGALHTILTTKTGKIWVMGANSNGELGIGKKYADQN
jgi:alpha-tubulin suppressor-like RCC1 family protein